MDKITVASFEEIMPKLIAASDVGGDVQRVFTLFAQRIAGKPIVPPGVVMAYFMVIDLVSKEQMTTPFLQQMMCMLFPDVVRNLFEDTPDFHADVLEFFYNVLKDANAASK